MSPDMWGVIGVQTAIAVATLGALIKLSSILSEAVHMIRSVDKRLAEDSKEHVKIIERLSVLDEDVRDLRREK